MTTIIVDAKSYNTLWSGELSDVEIKQLLQWRTLDAWSHLHQKFTTHELGEHRFVTYRKTELEHSGFFCIILADKAENQDMDSTQIQETIENYYTVQRVLTPEKRAWLAQMKEQEM